jgi:outer membrane protein assembly factor BamB
MGGQDYRARVARQTGGRIVTPTNEPRRLKRLWMPLGTLLLGIGGLTALVMADALEPILQFYTMMGIVLGTPLLLVVWILFFSGLGWVQRLVYLIVGSVVTTGLVFGLRQIVYMDGAQSGSGIPRLRWIWNKSEEASLADLEVKDAGKKLELKVEKDTDHPQFLGRNRDGVAHGVRLVRDWKTQPPEELWRRKIGLGWSAFAVAGDYAVTQEQRGDKELVVCYELKTGQPRWIHEHDARLRDNQGGDGPRATPTIVEGRVYTLGGTGILDCLDGASGKNLWSRDTLADNQRAHLIWGQSCSPLVLDDKVIVTGGRAASDPWKVEKIGPALLAYDRETGMPLWKAGNDAASYSSPAVATLADKRQILSVNAHSVTGHDPSDGKVLWEFAWPSDWAKASQPVPLPGDRVFLSAGYGVGCVLLHITRGSNDQWEVKEEWATRKMRTQFSNVVMVHDCAFGLDDRYLACVDLKTGEQKWKGERYDYGQVMLVGDVIVVQAEKGDVVLVEANPEEFKELARLSALHSKTWNNPVLSGPYLLVRNDKEAVCYRVPVAQSKK